MCTKYTFGGDGLEILGVYFDKVTVVGNLYKEAESSLQHLINTVESRITGFPTMSAVKGKIYGPWVHFEYDEMNGKSMKKGNFRLEYNPRKMPLDLQQQMVSDFKPMLHDVHFTRLDLAFDCDIDLGLYSHEHKNPMKRSEHYGLGGKLETLYFGSRTSNIYSRTYDKKQQLLDIEQKEIPEPILWRYEVEMKNRKFIDAMINFDFPIFERVRFIDYDITSLSGNDRVMVQALVDHPPLINELSSKTKAKYRKIIRGLGGNDVTPIFDSALKKELPQLKRQLEQWKYIPSISEIMGRTWF